MVGTAAPVARTAIWVPQNGQRRVWLPASNEVVAPQFEQVKVWTDPGDSPLMRGSSVLVTSSSVARATQTQIDWSRAIHRTI
jgi:hypothetical protein